MSIVEFYEQSWDYKRKGFIPLSDWTYELVARIHKNVTFDVVTVLVYEGSRDWSTC